MIKMKRLFRGLLGKPEYKKLLYPLVQSINSIFKLDYEITSYTLDEKIGVSITHHRPNFNLMKIEISGKDWDKLYKKVYESFLSYIVRGESYEMNDGALHIKSISIRDLIKK